jgi:malonyl-CoA O-methyltransferase
MKEKIASRFSLASGSYEDVAFVQKQCAKILVDKLITRTIAPRAILDLGTGTGQMPALLLEHYPDSAYTLNDISPAMIKVVAEKFKAQRKFSFQLGDMEMCDFARHDLVVSNFAMQWADNLQQLIAKYTRLCQTMAFSCLLKGTFQEWSSILQNYSISTIVDKYPEEGDLVQFASTLARADCDSQDFQLKFANVREFTLYLKKLGATSNQMQIPPSIIKDIVKRHEQEFVVTYKVFFCIIWVV